jgi:hypothetical protein
MPGFTQPPGGESSVENALDVDSTAMNDTGQSGPRGIDPAQMLLFDLS